MKASLYRSFRLAAVWLLLVAPPLLADTLDFSLPDLDGRQVQLSDFRGQWVIVNFWASWCGPCLREIPELVAFQNANPKHRVLGVNYELLSVEEIREFATDLKMNFPVLVVGESPNLPVDIAGLPTTLILDPDGQMVANHIGPVTQSMLEEFIASETASQTR